VNIRKYVEADFGGIEQVIKEIISTYVWPEIYPDGWAEERIKTEINVEGYTDAIFLVIEEKGRITGFIVAHDLETFIDKELSHLKTEFISQKLISDEKEKEHKETFYQRQIIITPEFHEGKRGTKLVEEIKKHARGKGYTQLVTRTPTRNEVGATFFKSLNYKEIFSENNPSRRYFKMNLI
jgi:GNAT superfamily N-acetyltransferase